MAMIVPRKIVIHDRQTSIRLEPQFWFYLRQIACEQGATAKALIEAVERARTPDRSLSSALRVYVRDSVAHHAPDRCSYLSMFDFT